MNRRSFLFIIILSVYSLTLKSQDYVTFPVDNAIWNVYLYTYFDYDSSSGEYTLTYSVDGNDTIYNEITYKNYICNVAEMVI